MRDALAAGRTETRATVHLVTQGPDEGPPIVRSWPFPVSPLVRDARSWSAVDMFKAYAFAHQEWMMRAASGPLVSAALRLVGSRQVEPELLAASLPSAVLPWDLDERGALASPPPFRALARARVVGL